MNFDDIPKSVEYFKQRRYQYEAKKIELTLKLEKAHQS